MTADEWLNQHGKKPWGLSGFWYWGTIADYKPDDPTNEPDETDFLLPDELFVLLQQRITYPNVKMYQAMDEAMADFQQAYSKYTTPSLGE